MSLSQCVWISPRAKRILLQRYLVAKIIFTEKEFALRDLCALFENQLWLEQKCQSDLNFLKLFGKDLETLSILLKEINFSTGTYTERALHRLSIRCKEQLEGFFLPLRNLGQHKTLYNGFFELRDPKQPGILKKNLPPVSRIGKGYRDKGSARDLAFDGSPRWQEVAAHHGPIYNKGVPDERIETSETTETLARRLLRKIEDIGG